MKIKEIPVEELENWIGARVWNHKKSQQGSIKEIVDWRGEPAVVILWDNGADSC